MNIFAVAEIGISELGRTHVIPMILSLDRKRNAEQVYMSRMMNTAGLAMVKVYYCITSMDGEAISF
jgi:hypothetical protein